MKRSSKLIRAVSLLVFAAAACYAGFSLYNRYARPFSTAAAVTGTVEDGFDCSGYVVRDETAFTVSGEFTGFDAAKGEHVHKGQTVASVYSTEAAYIRASERKGLQLTCDSLNVILSSGDMRDALYAEITALNRAARSGNSEALSSAASGLEILLLSGSGEPDAAALREMLDNYGRQINELDSVSLNDTQHITAAEAGLFCPDCDGFEGVGTKQLAGLSPTELKKLFFTPGGGNARIVTGINWYFAAVTDAENAGTLKAGGTFPVKFDTLASPLNMTVEKVGIPDADGMCVVLFRSDMNMDKALDLRFVSARIIIRQQEGFRIPAEAIVREDDCDCIYVVSGLQARRVDVAVIGSDGGDAVVCSDNELLYEGVQVIVTADGLYDGKVVG